LGGVGTGGIQESARIAWEGFRKRGTAQHEPAAVLSYGPAPDASSACQGDKIVATRTRGGILLRSLAHRWDAESLVIWHLGLSKLLPFLRGQRGQVLVFLHGVEAWRPLSRRLQRLLGRADSFLANSEFTWRRFVEFNPALANRPCQVVPLGSGEAEPTELLPEEPPSMLAISRLCRSEDYKGHRELIAVWPQVLARLPDARLWIAGDGDLRPDLERAAAPLGDRVQFWGRVSQEQKQALLRRCRCLAMPSRGEGFGLVYLEAMRLGRPCLVSTCDAGREVVHPPEAGLAVDPRDSVAVADAAVRLLMPGPEWDAWFAGARRRYAAHYTASQFQRRLLQAIDARNRASLAAAEPTESTADSVMRL
jgi:phosphatidylinositol alpha-1,6-mannosyltransferase